MSFSSMFSLLGSDGLWFLLIFLRISLLDVFLLSIFWHIFIMIFLFVRRFLIGVIFWPSPFLVATLWFVKEMTLSTLLPCSNCCCIHSVLFWLAGIFVALSPSEEISHCTRLLLLGSVYECSYRLFKNSLNGPSHRIDSLIVSLLAQYCPWSLFVSMISFSNQSIIQFFTPPSSWTYFVENMLCHAPFLWAIIWELGSFWHTFCESPAFLENSWFFFSWVVLAVDVCQCYFWKFVSCFANYPMLANSWSDVVRLLKRLFSALRGFHSSGRVSLYELSEKFQVLIFCSDGSLQTICSLWICLSGGFSFHDHFVNGQSRFDCFGLLLLAQELKIGFFWFLLELSMFISSFSLEFCEWVVDCDRAHSTSGFTKMIKRKTPARVKRMLEESAVAGRSRNSQGKLRIEIVQTSVQSIGNPDWGDHVLRGGKTSMHAIRRRLLFQFAPCTAPFHTMEARLLERPISTWIEEFGGKGADPCFFVISFPTFWSGEQNGRSQTGNARGTTHGDMYPIFCSVPLGRIGPGGRSCKNRSGGNPCHLRSCRAPCWCTCWGTELEGLCKVLSFSMMFNERLPSQKTTRVKTTCKRGVA